MIGGDAYVPAAPPFGTASGDRAHPASARPIPATSASPAVVLHRCFMPPPLSPLASPIRPLHRGTLSRLRVAHGACPHGSGRIPSCSRGLRKRALWRRIPGWGILRSRLLERADG